MINKNVVRGIAVPNHPNCYEGAISMTIYLYHKRHLITGLNYFGKTKSDPLNYLGSGIYWRNHLKKHGETIITVSVWEFHTQEECTQFAINFSIENNIVNSPEWANLCIEDGIGGGDILSQLDQRRYEEICKNRSIKTKNAWLYRDKVDHSIKQSDIWKSRSNEEKTKIYSKISSTLLNKTVEEREATRLKRKETESRRAPLTCPHCSLSSKNVANMNRYHFDKCKNKFSDG